MPSPANSLLLNIRMIVKLLTTLFILWLYWLKCVGCFMSAKTDFLLKCYIYIYQEPLVGRLLILLFLFLICVSLVYVIMKECVPCMKAWRILLWVVQ